MTDRELLEAAAKAVNGGSWHPLTHDSPNGAWNPLQDDGDALRLAVKLRIRHELIEVAGMEFCEVVRDDHDYMSREPVISDEMAATRRAIVRAAAAMGEKL